MNKPYVGISGVTTHEQIDALARQFAEAGFGPNASHVGMVGFLASRKTLMGQRRNDKHVESVEDLEELAASVQGRMLTAVHFETANDPGFARPLTELLTVLYRQELCRTVQLNVTPESDQVLRLLDQYPDLNLVYQIRPEVMARGPQGVVQEIGRHRNAFQYTIIDPSCGHGKDFNPEQAIQIHDALRHAFPDSIPCFSGGFSGDNAENRVRLIRSRTNRSDFSTDAEDKLRNDRNVLDLSKTPSYIIGNARGFGLQKHSL